MKRGVLIFLQRVIKGKILFWKRKKKIKRKQYLDKWISEKEISLPMTTLIEKSSAWTGSITFESALTLLNLCLFAEYLLLVNLSQSIALTFSWPTFPEPGYSPSPLQNISFLSWKEGVLPEKEHRGIHLASGGCDHTSQLDQLLWEGLSKWPHLVYRPRTLHSKTSQWSGLGLPLWSFGQWEQAAQEHFHVEVAVFHQVGHFQIRTMEVVECLVATPAPSQTTIFHASTGSFQLWTSDHGQSVSNSHKCP